MLVRRYQGAPAVTFSKHMVNMCHLINFQEQKYEDGSAHDGRMRECGPAKAGRYGDLIHLGALMRHTYGALNATVLRTPRTSTVRVRYEYEYEIFLVRVRYSYRRNTVGIPLR
jgi:hypothetical protein